MCEFEGWLEWLEPAFLLWKPGGPGYVRPPYMTRTDEDKPHYTPEQEFDIMDDQVNRSDGFDIDFSSFLGVFNYHPANLSSHQFVDKPETTGDLLKSLSLESLDDYNQENKTEYEFVKVVKANYHWSAAIMFLITLEVKDPYDDQIKLFQVRVRHALDILTQHVFCRPKPNQGVECVGTFKKHVVEKDVVQQDVKKQRLE